MTYTVNGATFDAEALRKNRAWTAAVINLARGENPKLQASYSACLYCKALPRCPEAQRMIMNAMEALEDLGAPLDAYNMADLIGAAKLAEEFAYVGKALGKAFIVAGNAVPGWKLGNPRAIRSVSEPAIALAKLAEAGISPIALALVGALSFKVGKIPPEVMEHIGSHITEELSQPPLTADKSTAISKGAA